MDYKELVNCNSSQTKRLYLCQFCIKNQTPNCKLCDKGRAIMRDEKSKKSIFLYGYNETVLPLKKKFP